MVVQVYLSAGPTRGFEINLRGLFPADEKAYEKALDELIRTGRCEVIEDGEPVMLIEPMM